MPKHLAGSWRPSRLRRRSGCTKVTLLQEQRSAHIDEKGVPCRGNRLRRDQAAVLRAERAEPTLIKAAVCHRFGDPLVVETLALDAPESGEVLVDVKACAICASDLHACGGAWGGDLPAVNGHEAAGVVRTVGAGVTSVVPGQRVVVSLLRSCGECFFCAHEMVHLCSGRHDFPIATSTRLHDPDGRPVVQGVYTGAFAEAVVVHASQVVPIPDVVPFDCAALLACGVATGFGASTKSVPVEQRSHAVVIGAGGVGLNTIQGARHRRAASIIAVDVSEAKLRDAQEFGATHVVNVAHGESDVARETVAELTEGRGADAVFVTVGSTAAIEQGLELCRDGGTVVVVGMTPEGENASFDASAFASHAKTIVGAFMGSTDLAVDIPSMVELYVGGELMLDELITARYPLDAINDAMASTASGNARRNVVVFDD